MKKIAIVGSSNTDLVIKTDRIPAPGETIIGGDFAMVPGGKGANQAVAVARLGGNVTFVANIGNDIFGAQSKASYQTENVDVTYVTTDKEAPSGMAIISVDKRGENSIVVAPGANSKLSIGMVEAARGVIEQVDYLLVQLEVPLDVVEYAVNIAFTAGAKVILNPAPAAKLSPALLSKLYLITPNKTEAEQLTGVKIESKDDVVRAAHILRDMGVENVLITMGAEGSYLLSETIEHTAPIRRVEALDTTAAGDVFNGAMCVALSEGKDMVEAMHFATIASSISVSRIGAQSSIPTRKELDELMDTLSRV